MQDDLQDLLEIRKLMEGKPSTKGLEGLHRLEMEELLANDCTQLQKNAIPTAHSEEYQAFLHQLETMGSLGALEKTGTGIHVAWMFWLAGAGNWPEKPTDIKLHCAVRPEA